MADAVRNDAPFPRLAGRLPCGRLGTAFHAFRVIGSTQDELRRLAESGAREGTVVVSDHQTRGRGRMQRSWLDEPGSNLLFSLLFRPEIPPARVPQLSLLAAVACAEALGAVTGLAIRIRWPNDLMANGRKVAGILAEAATAGDRVAYVLLGIGINVNQKEFPADLAARATSLTLELDRPLDRETLLEALLGSLERWYARYLTDGFAPVRAAWREASASLGQRVEDGAVGGTVEDLDLDGGLLVRTVGGDLVRLVAGEFR